jgi:hypothetical protein
MHNYSEMGAQNLAVLFGLNCLICLKTAAEKYDEPRLIGSSQDHIDRVRTPCGKYKPKSRVINPLTEPGHSFCRNCIETAFKYGCDHPEYPESGCDLPRCPTCKTNLLYGIARLRSFRTVPCGYACEEGLNDVEADDDLEAVR